MLHLFEEGRRAMTRISRSFVVLVLATLGACAGPRTESGSVVMKVSETEAHVRLTDRDIPVGTRVQLYSHTCVSQAGKRYECDKRLVAVGTVAQQMGGDYAVVQFPQGTRYEEGYTVEVVR
jgi:hypothetical protein